MTSSPFFPGLVSLTTSGLLSEAGRVLAAIIGPKSMYRHIPPFGVRYSGTCDGLRLGVGEADGVAPGGATRRRGTGAGLGDRLGTSTTGTTGGSSVGDAVGEATAVGWWEVFAYRMIKVVDAPSSSAMTAASTSRRARLGSPRRAISPPAASAAAWWRW